MKLRKGAIGNPTTYKDIELSWNGRQLMTYGTNASYAYNAEGIRKSKTVNGSTTTFNLVGSTILSQTKNGQTLVFLYDGNGTLIGFKDLSTDKDYFYLKNLQGDIVKIIDTNKTVVATYEYDDWGKLLTTDEDLTYIAELNPFRYRGYYYDTESNLYYLNSRYYDPETGRFVNADAYVSTGQGLSGNNMFAYCNDNPIINADSSGQVGLSILLKFAVQSVCYGLMNATSSWMAAKATGQDFNGLDWFASFSVGLVSQLPGVGSIASGIMAGGYTFYTSIKNGATYEEAAFNATTTFVTTAVSVSSFVAGSSDKVIKDVADYAIDAAFMTGNNTVAAATNKSVNTVVSSREQRQSTSDAQIICLTFTAYGFLPY